MSETEFEFVDRYSVTGTPYPDPETVCEGGCGGMGCYPHKSEEAYTEEQLLAMTPRELIEYGQWIAPHSTAGHFKDMHGVCDGYHFIRCVDCGGTGKRNLPAN